MSGIVRRGNGGAGPGLGFLHGRPGVRHPEVKIPLPAAGFGLISRMFLDGG